MNGKNILVEIINRYFFFQIKFIIFIQLNFQIIYNIKNPKYNKYFHNKNSLLNSISKFKLNANIWLEYITNYKGNPDQHKQNYVKCLIIIK